MTFFSNTCFPTTTRWTWLLHNTTSLNCSSLLGATLLKCPSSFLVTSTLISSPIFSAHFLTKEEEEDDMGQSSEFLDRPWQVVMAWKDVSKGLMSRVEQIECGLRLMVPALTDRIKKVQGGFVGRVAEDWVGFCEGKREGVKLVIEEAMKEEMEELVTVFMDANRLRKSVITEIVGALTVYQAALFLEALAQFLVGFRDPDLVAEFKRTNNFAITGGLHLGF